MMCGRRETMLKFMIFLCTLNLRLATCDGIRYIKESNPAIISINSMFERTRQKLEDFNEISNIHLSKHGNESLKKIDDLDFNMTKEIDEITESRQNEGDSLVLCLEDWFKVKRSAMKSKMSECLERQKTQLQDCSEYLGATLLTIMFSDIFNGSRKCEDAVLSMDLTTAIRTKRNCYENLKIDVKKSLGGFKLELRRIKKALRENNPIAVNIESCSPPATTEDIVQELLESLKKKEICSTDTQPHFPNNPSFNLAK